MEELRIQIEIVSDRIIEIELKVDDFSRYGMSPTRDDRLALSVGKTNITAFGRFHDP